MVGKDPTVKRLARSGFTSLTAKRHVCYNVMLYLLTSLFIRICYLDTCGVNCVSGSCTDTNVCSECNDGFKGVNCETPCDKGFHGPSCSVKCMLIYMSHLLPCIIKSINNQWAHRGSLRFSNNVRSLMWVGLPYVRWRSNHLYCSKERL
jgi:hypothetical protein